MCYERLIQAISRGVEKQRQTSTNESQKIHREGKDSHGAASAGAPNRDKSAVVSLAQQFRDLTLNKYSSIEKAWEIFDSLSDQPGVGSRASYFGPRAGEDQRWRADNHIITYSPAWSRK